MLLSLLANSSPEIVQRHIEDELIVRVLHVLSDHDLVEQKSILTLQFKAPPEKVQLLIHAMHNFAASGLLHSKAQLLERVVLGLYAMLGPIEESLGPEKVSERGIEKFRNMAYADLLESSVLEAILATLKACLQGNEKAQAMIARKL